MYRPSLLLLCVWGGSFKITLKKLFVPACSHDFDEELKNNFKTSWPAVPPSGENGDSRKNTVLKQMHSLNSHAFSKTTSPALLVINHTSFHFSLICFVYIADRCLQTSHGEEWPRQLALAVAPEASPSPSETNGLSFSKPYLDFPKKTLGLASKKWNDTVS